MNVSMRSAGILLVVLFLMIGCVPRPMKQRPDKHDLYGKWVLTKASLENIGRYFKCSVTNTSVILNSDGTYEATDMPVVHGMGNDPIYSCVSTVGRWRLDEYPPWQVYLFIREFDDGIAYLVHQLNGKVILFAPYTICDPDGPGYYLERISE